MNFSFRDLHIHVSMTIAPQAIVKTYVAELQLKIWNVYVSNELIEVRLQLAEHLPGPDTEKCNWTASVQQHLIMLSDQVNNYMTRERKIWINHPFAADLRSHYLYILSELDSLDREILLRYPNHYDSAVKHPDFRLLDILPQLRRQIDDLHQHLKSSLISDRLLWIFIDGLKMLLQPQMLSRQSEKYIHDLVEEVRKQKNIDEKTLLEILLQHNFNKPELLLYQIENMEGTLFEIHGLHEQVEKLVQLKGSLFHKTSLQQQSLHPGQRSLKDEIAAFCQQKIAYLEKLIIVKQKTLRDKNELQEVFRMATLLSVPQLALFIRILREKGVLIKKETGEVFSFFARYVYTDNARFISARNMVKKSTEVEFSTALKIWDLLGEMRDWLDEHFDVRNYQRS